MRFVPSLPRKYKGPIAAGTIGLVLLVAADVYGNHGLVRLRQQEASLEALEQRAFLLQQHNEQLRERIERLRGDDRFVEKLARERLGLVKKGEVVYRVRPATGPAPKHD